MSNSPSDITEGRGRRDDGGNSDTVLSQALGRARWSIFWERLWPGLASIATVIGLFLALSWLGLWLWLPPIGRAVGLGVFFPAHGCGLLPAADAASAHQE